MIDLAEAPALDIARAVQSGEISAAAVIEAALDRIARCNPVLNAFTDVTPERARKAAAAIDQGRAKGAPPGALAGVPFAVKNLLDVKGLPTRAGSKINRELPPAKRDSLLIERLEAQDRFPSAGGRAASVRCWSAPSTWANTPMISPARISTTVPRATPSTSTG